MMQKTRIQSVVLSTFLFFGLLSCTNYEKRKVNVDFSDTIIQKPNSIGDSLSPIYIAIASMTSPRETFNYYHDLIDFISKKVGRPIYFKQKKTYKEVNELLETGEVDFAFICSGAYIEEAKHKHVKLLVAPVINEQTYYQAYIIAQKNSAINSFNELEGHSFAYTDPLSNTGYLYPRKHLFNLVTNENIFFSKTIFTNGHDISIQMVNRGIIDASSVHGLIFDYIASVYPERVENIKIIEKSELFGMPPVVTPIDLDNKYFKRYRDIFLSIHEDSVGMEILNKLKIEKFVLVKDSIYDNVRRLKI
ncbi:MAG: phosphate/phosphite/phosphonate ABC transporter substrate-binding protein [Bacteroidetes bacterium]|nr:MAG: phosphate/phosphite/phosphonate ABC transporter substrate-binding protein [Bacteroidota bacterium]